jgi:predicted dehydrogenase
MPLRIAVIGVGHLGRHHARILGRLAGVQLVGVVDINRERAAQVAAEHGTRAYETWQDIPGGLEAVTVAVPTGQHVDVALPLIERGVHVLVEKPMARSVEDADRLIAAARARGTVLAVGHTERFNPAVALARPLLKALRFVEAHRLGTFPDRSLDIDVVFDLMIHDLDLVLDLVGREVTSVEAVGIPVLTTRVDIANVRMRFEGGCIANLTASRISRERVRKIRFFQKDVYVSVDCAAQEVEGWRLVREGEGPPSIEGGKLEVPREEPLKREMDDFVGAVRDRRPPAVTGEQGRAALALAARVVERMEQNV